MLSSFIFAVIYVSINKSESIIIRLIVKFILKGYMSGY